jgi:type IX secretion system PorP/SprF family membrane protein
MSLFVIELKAQDPHFTQFSDAPMFVNPANTGFYRGLYRVTGNFRNQWDYRFINNNDVGSRNTGYTTFAGGFDISLKPSKNSTDMLGIGIQLLTDRAGEVALTSTFGQINLAYWKKLDPNKNRWLSAGFSIGFEQRKIDYSHLELPDQYNSANPQSPLAVLSYPVNNGYIYTDIGMGAKYFATLTKKRMLNIGFAIAHINQPKNSFFFGLPSDQLYRKLTFHAGMRMPIAHKIDLAPTILIMRQATWMEFDEGAYVRFLLTEAKSKELMAYNIGIWFRQANGSGHFVQDAINLCNKLEFNQYTIGISYDLNVSKLTQTTKLKGGVELSISYQNALDASLGNKKKPICPVF